MVALKVRRIFIGAGLVLLVGCASAPVADLRISKMLGAWDYGVEQCTPEAPLGRGPFYSSYKTHSLWYKQKYLIDAQAYQEGMQEAIAVHAQNKSVCGQIAEGIIEMDVYLTKATYVNAPPKRRTGVTQGPAAPAWVDVWVW